MLHTDRREWVRSSATACAHAQPHPTLCALRTVAPGLLCPWGFPGKKTGVGCHFLPGDLSNPGIKPTSLVSPALANVFFTTSASWKVPYNSLGVFKENWIPACLTGGRPALWSGGLRRWERMRPSSNPMKKVTFQSYIYILHHTACRTLVTQPGIECRSLAAKAHSPNHWTTREFPATSILVWSNTPSLEEAPGTSDPDRWKVLQETFNRALTSIYLGLTKCQALFWAHYKY